MTGTRNEYAYIGLLRNVASSQDVVEQRAVLASTGERPKARSLLGPQVTYDLREGFPLLTTKKMPFKTIVHEFVWFVRGATNIRYLQWNGVKIWDAWADENGELGPCYPSYWRAFEGPDGKVDQLANLVRDIAAVAADPNHPAARRLVLTAWHPADMPTRAPPGCHTLSQFHVRGDTLHAHLYQRSADMFLGVPFNVASYALLVEVLAKLTGLKAGKLVHTFGDAHVYENHVPQVFAQLLREPFDAPTLKLAHVRSIDDIDSDTFSLENYVCCGALGAEVAV